MFLEYVQSNLKDFTLFTFPMPYSFDGVIYPMICKSDLLGGSLGKKRGKRQRQQEHFHQDDYDQGIPCKLLQNKIYIQKLAMISDGGVFNQVRDLESRILHMEGEIKSMKSQLEDLKSNLDHGHGHGHLQSIPTRQTKQKSQERGAGKIVTSWG